MKPLPQSEKTLLLRTDFSDEAVWKEICSEVRKPGPELQEPLGMFAAVYEAMGQSIGEMETALHIVDDPEYRDLSSEQLLELLPGDSNQALMLVVDRGTVSDHDHPVLVVDLCVERGRKFRSVPSQVFAIESNLSIANMDWEDFAGLVDDKGVFRGFPK